MIMTAYYFLIHYVRIDGQRILINVQAFQIIKYDPHKLFNY